MGTTNKVKTVEDRMPNMMAIANPLKTGSNVITKLPSNVVPAVSNTGLIRTVPA